MTELSANLPQFAGSQAVGFVLVMCRVGGLFVLAPIFSGRMIPMQAKLIIAGAISFTLMPLVTATGVPTGLAVVPLMVKEIDRRPRLRARARRRSARRSSSPPRSSTR